MKKFGWLGAAAALVCLTAACAPKTPAVLCSCTYGGEEQRLVFPATREPYRAKAVDIGERFRFKAVYVREPWRASSVNVYAYQHTDDRDVLLQEGKYSVAFAAAASRGRYGFTGRQLVYSPTPNEPELEYWCELSR